MLLPKFFEENDFQRLENGCLVYKGEAGAEGYVRYGRSFLLHRQVFKLNKGEIPLGTDVHHSCKNKKCIELTHLKLLTHQEHGSVSSPNTKKTHCPRGHEYTPENTSVWIDSVGTRHRKCLRCKQIRYRLTS